jgi:predicted phosphodiesterase
MPEQSFSERTPLLKIAVLSDIHGNLLALQRVMQDFQRRSVDQVINLGDHASGPLWPKETVQLLMEQDWLQVRGNHERQMTTLDPARHGPSDRYAYGLLNEEERKWLADLPATLEFSPHGLAFHGSPQRDTDYLLESVEQGRAHLAGPMEIQSRLGTSQAGLYLCGHSHTPRAVALPGQVLIINPGSVGLPAYEDDGPRPHVIETGSPHARYAMLELDHETWAVDLIAVEYDYERAAEQARRNHRPDWEIALRSGFMQR